MEQILLLVFIHGFRGSDFTFGDFPIHLKDTVANNLPGHKVESIVYPKYETRGDLAQSTAAFSEWLKERVMDLRKAHFEKPWPPNDRNVSVVLVAHSMGGFVATDCLFRALDEHRQNESRGPIFPLIRGILAFDTPLNGLARSMFVYGAFSNYHKVSRVFNIMTALSAATPAAISRLAAKRAVVRSATGRIAKRAGAGGAAWKAWQLVAMRTGTVGVIAAGGVAAFMHRKKIVEGLRAVRGLTRADVVQGYQQSVDALGQGLAYVNRGNVGESFAWLSDHFTFVGALLRQNELGRRLERLAALRGVGVRDVYASLGENGYWSGGYFVPERTFCAIPSKPEDEPVSALFTRHVMEGVKDEIEAHVGLFRKEKNKDYEKMTNDAAKLVVDWFNDETEIYDDPKFQEPPPAEPAETEAIASAVDNEDIIKAEETLATGSGEGLALEEKEDVEMVTVDEGSEDEVPDESPIDIAAAAALVPLPDDIDQDLPQDGTGEDGDGDGSCSGSGKADQKRAYLRHLFGVAQQTGTSLRAYLPSGRLPTVEMPKVPIPSMPSIPAMPSMAVPTRMNPFSKRPATEESVSVEGREASGSTADASASAPADVVDKTSDSEDHGVAQ